MSTTVKAMASILKYLSIKTWIRGPNIKISPPTIKNLADRETVDASRNMRKLILNAPAVMVNTL